MTASGRVDELALIVTPILCAGLEMAELDNEADELRLLVNAELCTMLVGADVAKIELDNDVDAPMLVIATVLGTELGRSELNERAAELKLVSAAVLCTGFDTIVNELRLLIAAVKIGAIMLETADVGIIVEEDRVNDDCEEVAKAENLKVASTRIEDAIALLESKRVPVASAMNEELAMPMLDESTDEIPRMDDGKKNSLV